MSLLDEKNFSENQNGRVTQSQLAELKEKASQLLYLKIGVFLLGTLVLIYILYNRVPWVAFEEIGSFVVLVLLLYRLPALIKYYLFILPDARANNLAHTTAQLEYRNGYILQGEDVRLSLPGFKNDGLLIGTYEVFYLPRAKLAISAKPQYIISASLQAEQFTLLFGKVIGFSEEDLAANRNGSFPFTQRLKVLQKNWFIFLALTVMVFVFSYVIFSSDIVLALSCFGEMLFTLGLIYLVTLDAKGVVAALLGRKIEQVEGVAYISSRRSGNSDRYYFEIHQVVSLEIHKRIYNVLMSGLYYRVFYTPGTKYLLSLEILSGYGQRERSSASRRGLPPD